MFEAWHSIFNFILPEQKNLNLRGSFNIFFSDVKVPNLCLNMYNNRGRESVTRTVGYTIISKFSMMCLNGEQHNYLRAYKIQIISEGNGHNKLYQTCCHLWKLQIFTVYVMTAESKLIAPLDVLHNNFKYYCLSCLCGQQAINLCHVGLWSLWEVV